MPDHSRICSRHGSRDRVNEEGTIIRDHLHHRAGRDVSADGAMWFEHPNRALAFGPLCDELEQVADLGEELIWSEIGYIDLGKTSQIQAYEGLNDRALCI